MIELWEEQRSAYEWAKDRDEAALLCEQRTGKTYLTLAILQHIVKPDFVGCLVGILNNLDSTWRVGLAAHLPHVSVTSDWSEFKKLPTPKLFLIHYQRFTRVVDKLARYKKLTWMCFDEAHGLAKRGSKQSRAAARMSWVSRKLILTGTPIEKKPTDMFAQFRFLAPDVFGTNWEEFENEYMEFAKLDMRHTPKGSVAWQRRILQQRILRSKATFNRRKLGKFTRLIKPYSFRLTKGDVGIKEPIITPVLVPIFGPQRLLYERMTKHHVIRLPNGSRAMAALEVTAIMKRRQLASGFVYDDEGELHHVGRAKLRRLILMAKRLPKPVVIFTAFLPDLHRISDELEELGYDVMRVWGKTKKSERGGIWQSFQRAQYDFLVCQDRAGGVGVDLWKAQYAIVHSMSHSSIVFDQMKSRLDSRHKETAPEIFLLCSEGTIDEELYDLVIVKGLNSAEVLKQLKRSK